MYVAAGGITAGVTMHDLGGYHWSKCHTPLGCVVQGFMDKAF